MFLLTLILSLYGHSYSSELCNDLDTYYLIGNYKACSNSEVDVKDSRCTYIQALCKMALNDHDVARYAFSTVTGDYKDLALASIVELHFATGNPRKAKVLAKDLNSTLSKRTRNTYPYFVTELLLTKSHLNSFDVRSANDRLRSLRSAGLEELFYESLE